jgi:hypothetical protein
MSEAWDIQPLTTTDGEKKVKATATVEQLKLLGALARDGSEILSDPYATMHDRVARSMLVSTPILAAHWAEEAGRPTGDVKLGITHIDFFQKCIEVALNPTERIALPNVTNEALAADLQPVAEGLQRAAALLQQ